MKFVHWNDRTEEVGRYGKLLYVLLEDEYYNTRLDALAVMVYSLLCDRQTLSIQTGEKFRDKNGDYFCLYSRQDIADTLKISTRHVDKLFKQLKDANLLISVRSGYNKPNHLYVGLPVITLSDTNRPHSSAGGATLVAHDMPPSYSYSIQHEKKENAKHAIWKDTSYYGNVFKLYDYYYSEMHYKHHPRIVSSQYDRVTEAFELTGLTPSDIGDYVEYHFRDLPHGNDGNINSFIHALPRYIKEYY